MTETNPAMPTVIPNAPAIVLPKLANFEPSPCTLLPMLFTDAEPFVPAFSSLDSNSTTRFESSVMLRLASFTSTLYFATISSALLCLFNLA
jgi:hypothetical protein